MLAIPSGIEIPSGIKNSRLFATWAAVSGEGFLNMSGVSTPGEIAAVGEL